VAGACVLAVAGWSMLAAWQTERNADAWARNLTPLFDGELKAENVAVARHLAAPPCLPWANTENNGSGQMI
jgi:hypothetical protein